jgi:ribosomal subunit interface protein
MEISIHARGVNLAEDFAVIAKERIERLSRFSVPIDRVVVEVIHETNPHHGKNAAHHVTITSHGSGPLVRAAASAFNDLAAFDEAAETIELQLRKKHEKAKAINRDTLRKRKAM